MPNESIEIIAQKRERAIIRTSMIGVGTNVMLAVFKAIIGLISNSIATGCYTQYPEVISTFRLNTRRATITATLSYRPNFSQIPPTRVFLPMTRRAPCSFRRPHILLTRK